ncbi:hypothetical protein CPBP_00145 [Candidatus Bodocaedibacter vickermanii]|uniref:Uncharacterized protein n=1 Tax=Candidatus Bodocaedibacter vickermanii TaxID=2741701 RepID=A0A7L9RS04_9PROT|nr:hypothetical protein CPBP_00145 [Candidatus Paracaedibacteraceae bacterium 'Lake Konstanz']
MLPAQGRFTRQSGGLPLSNRIAICLSRIKTEAGINERVDTAGRYAERDLQGALGCFCNPC